MEKSRHNELDTSEKSKELRLARETVRHLTLKVRSGIRAATDGTPNQCIPTHKTTK
ncbi:MAG: hypothetical protein ACLQVI_16535 [Polyangiaceae bacterium]